MLRSLCEISMTFVHDLNDIEDTALLICHSIRVERYVMHEFYFILFLFTAITSNLL